MLVSGMFSTSAHLMTSMCRALDEILDLSPKLLIVRFLYLLMR